MQIVSRIESGDSAARSERPAEPGIREAARDFEGLLIASMLKSIRESASADSSDSDQAGAVALEMADEQMSKVLAQNGGLGLARILTEGLSKGGDQSPKLSR